MNVAPVIRFLRTPLGLLIVALAAVVALFPVSEDFSFIWLVVVIAGISWWLNIRAWSILRGKRRR